MSVVSVLFRIPNHNTGPQTPKHVRYTCIYAHLSGWWSGRKAQWPKQLNLYCHGLLAGGHSEIADQHLLLRMESIKDSSDFSFPFYLKKKKGLQISRKRILITGKGFCVQLRSWRHLHWYVRLWSVTDVSMERWCSSNLYYIRNCLGNMSPRKLIRGSSKMCLLLHVC